MLLFAGTITTEESVKRWSTADTGKEKERERETSNRTSQEVAKNKVRKFETLPFGHRREHLGSICAKYKRTNASLRADHFLSLSLSLSHRKFRVRSEGLENFADSPVRPARLFSSVQINGSAPRVGRRLVSCWLWLLLTAY